MRSHVARRLLYAAGVTSLLATGAAAAPAAVAAPDRPAVSGPEAAALAVDPAGGGSPVLLITGLRFGFGSGPNGRPEPMMLPARSGSAGQTMPITGLSLGRRSFEIPADALPYLGHGLDPNLFDLAALRHLEHGGRLPVQVTYQGHVPVLPGIRITRAAAGTARGYLTAASALKFGAALRRQFTADHDRVSYGTDGLFAHGVSLALAGAAVARPVKPQFQMHTLTVRGTNLVGQPDNGDVIAVVNADDAARFDLPFDAFASLENGVAKFSVPKGHYWVIGEFFTGNGSNLRLVVRPQITVLTDHGVVDVDERTASSEVRVTTPRPAVVKYLQFTAIRTPGLPGGQSSAIQEDMLAGRNLWVSPTRQRPTVGGLQTFTQAQMASRTTRSDRQYAYSVDIEGPAGLIRPQHLTVRPSSLAVVDNRYFQDFASVGGWFITGGTRAEFSTNTLVIINPAALRLPGHLVEYVTARPDVVWSQTYFQFVDVTPGFPSTAGGQSDAFRSFRPGQHVTEKWNIYPLHPQPVISQARFGPLFQPPVPTAARVGDVLTLDPVVFSDNTAGHQGAGYFDGTSFDGSISPTVGGHFLIEQNGRKLASGNPVDGLPQVKLAGRPSVVRFTLTAWRTDPRYDLSTASDTTWTWRSRPEATAKVPAPWVCLPSGASTFNDPYSRRCVVQPMLTLGYQVAGLRTDGSTAPGRQVIRLSVGHLRLAGDPAIARASMRVSFDGGKTWHVAKVTRVARASRASRAGGPGQFTVAFTAPAKAFVTLRVSAVDQAGGSVFETITSAYKTSS